MARSTASPSPGVVRLPAPTRLAWLRSPVEESGSGIIYALTVAAAQDAAAFLRVAGMRSPPTPGTPKRRNGKRSRPARRGRGEGPGRDVRARHGLRRRSQVRVHLGHRSRRSPTTSRWVAPAVRRRDGLAAAQTGDRDIWAYFASLSLPEQPCGRPSTCSATLPCSMAGRSGDVGRAAAHPAGDAAEGAGCRRRRTPREGGWVSTGRAVVLRRGALRPFARPGGAKRTPMLEYHARPGAGCGFCASSWTTRARPTAAGATTAAGSTLSAAVSDAAVAEAGEALSRPGVAIEPRKLWPTALANLGLELKGKIANGPSTGAGDRPAHRPRPRAGAASALPGRRRGRSGPAVAGGGPADRDEGLVGRLGRATGRDRRHRVRDPAPARRRPRHRAVQGHADPDRRPVRDRGPVRGPRPGCGQLGATGRRHQAALRAGRRRPGRSGASRRRPRRQRLDPDGGRRRPARRRRHRRASPARSAPRPTDPTIELVDASCADRLRPTRPGAGSSPAAPRCDR